MKPALLKFDERHVRLGQAAPDKTAAIRMAGAALVEAGFIAPAYVDSMLARELAASTYLGNSIAIPHGLPAARHLVLATGVVVVQFPAGVDWDDGERARLVVGIAASPDEHLQILASLTGVLGDESIAERLALTLDVVEMITALHSEPRAQSQRPTALPHERHVNVVAVIGSPREAQQAVDAGSEGVGLSHTEILFLEREEPPSEDEQVEAYRAMMRATSGHPLRLRTLDLGGAERIPYLFMPAERNPLLGVRGVRLGFRREALFRAQLRAVFRVSGEGPVRLVYPMIATLEDLQKAKAITEEVRREVSAAPVEIGIVIQVPSAVMMADELAREVSFFSINTSDLTQYVLALDLRHPVLGAQADGLHPAVLRMIELTVAAARRAGIWVGACGILAEDPVGAVVLAGLGVDEFSVSVPRLAAIKARLRGLAMADAEALARGALACPDAAAVRALVESAAGTLAPAR